MGGIRAHYCFYEFFGVYVGAWDLGVLSFSTQIAVFSFRAFKLKPLQPGVYLEFGLRVGPGTAEFPRDSAPCRVCASSSCRSWALPQYSGVHRPSRLASSERKALCHLSEEAMQGARARHPWAAQQRPSSLPACSRWARWWPVPRLLELPSLKKTLLAGIALQPLRGPRQQFRRQRS